jgi:hypothetical protein
MSGHLTTDQRAELSRRIAELRRRATSRLAALERDHDAIVTGSADAVRDDEHDPEGATIAFERAQTRPDGQPDGRITRPRQPRSPGAAAPTPDVRRRWLSPRLAPGAGVAAAT